MIPQAVEDNYLFIGVQQILICLHNHHQPEHNFYKLLVQQWLSVKRGERNISYVSSGEGTTSQGEFHEAVNWASREKLPVLFVIQNNKYAISVHVSNQSGGKDSSIAEMMEGFHNLHRARIDGTDFFQSYEKIQEAIEYIKSGKGPALIEADVVRLESHSSSDDQKKYRDKKELEEDLKNVRLKICSI
jgi:2-oxoisovalerate dehydrogenase E1 component